MKHDIWNADYKRGFLTIPLKVKSAEKLRGLGYLLQVDKSKTNEFLKNKEKLKRNLRNKHYFNGEFKKYKAASGLDCYRTVEKTYSDLDKLARVNPKLVSFKKIGESWRKKYNKGGYDLKVFKITNHKNKIKKPKLFIEASIHPREMATAELVTRFIEMLVSKYNKNSEIKNLLDTKEVHILPYVNPDGRKFAELGDYKRKNENLRFCGDFTSRRGIDLNRNFKTQLWGTGDGTSGSSSACAQTFRGPNPESEPETSSLVNYVEEIFKSNNKNFKTNMMYISVHSYGKYVLTPDSKGISVQTQKKLDIIGKKMAKHNDYEVCEPSDCLYSVHGASSDWAFERFNIPSYTFELGSSFFENCSSFEQNILTQNLKALTEGLRIIK